MPNQNEIYEEAIKQWRALSEKKEAQYTARCTEYIRHEIEDASIEATYHTAKTDELRRYLDALNVLRDVPDAGAT